MAIAGSLRTAMSFGGNIAKNAPIATRSYEAGFDARSVQGDERECCRISFGPPGWPGFPGHDNVGGIACVDSVAGYTFSCLSFLRLPNKRRVSKRPRRAK